MDKNLKIGIIGLGLIGGSIFKALCALKCQVYGVSKSEQTLIKAKKYSSNVSTELNILENCDIVFVCTPMNKTLKILDDLELVLNEKTIVADVSSLKGFLCNKRRKYVFVPTHPMAGTEGSGFDSSFESLFQDAKWVLTPFEDTMYIDLKKLSEVIQTLGATPVFAKPDEHDEAVALISHMPMIVSQALLKVVEDKELPLLLASSGFRDMTRLAASNEEMAQDMINLNSDNIQKSLLMLYSAIGELLSGDYQTQILSIKALREKMYQNGKNVLR